MAEQKWRRPRFERALPERPENGQANEQVLQDGTKSDETDPCVVNAEA